MNKERKEAEKVKNDIESVQEQLEQHAGDIQTGNLIPYTKGRGRSIFGGGSHMYFIYSLK
jgi:hypothetical protein